MPSPWENDPVVGGNPTPWASDPEVKPWENDPEPGPEMRPVRGFWNNLRLPWKSFKHMLGAPAGGASEESVIHNAFRAAFGEDEDKPDKTIISLNEVLADFEERGLEGTPEYQQHLDRLSQVIDEQESGEVSEFSFGALVSAFQEDSGAVAAELTNALIADPELLVVPLGASKAAAKAAKAVAARGRTVQAMARVAGGSLGAGGTGAAVIAPISVAEQAAEKGTVNWGEVWNDMVVTGALSAPLGGFVAGVSALPPLMAKAAPRLAEDSVGAAAATAHPGNTLEEAISGILNGPRNLVKETLGEAVARKAVTYLDDPAQVSPSMREIRNLFEYTEFSDIPIKPSYFERQYMATGKYASRLQESMESLSGMFTRRIPKSVNDQVLNDLRGIKASSGKASIASKQIRALSNEVREYAVDAGLDVGYIENHFPRVYNANKVEANRGEFAKALSPYMPIENADVIARRIINNDGVLVESKTTTARLVDESWEYVPSRVGEPTRVSRNPNIEMSRKLKDIPDKVLAPYLEDNVYDVMRKYIMGVTRRAEYARSFGKGEQKLNNLMRNAIREGAESGRPITRKEIKRVYELADAVQRRYQPIQSKVIRDLNRGLGAYQLLRTLPLATISSLSEPLIILARGRMKSTLKAVPAIMGHAISGAIRTVFKKFPKPEATRALENVGIGLDIGITERLMASFGGEATRVTDKFFKATLLHQWTRLNRVAGFHAGRNMVIDHLDDLAKGVRRGKANRLKHELAELGVDYEKGVDWVRRGKPRAEFKEDLDAAALRFTNEVVMDPRATNRPMWHSNPHLHLLSQLKGFQTVFGNTVMKRWAHEIFAGSNKTYNAVKISTTGMLMVMVAMWGNEFREALKYGPKGNPKFRNEEFKTKLLRAVDRTGFTGAGQFAIDSFYAYRFGSSGLTQALGPAASQLDHLIFRGLGQAFSGDTSKLELEIANAIPFANAHKPARDKIREIVEDVAD